ncbi:MAG: 2-hydroxyacid dehydrogenase [Fuerstiella sp.]
MKVAVFSTKAYDREFLTRFNANHQLYFFEARLSLDTVRLASECDAICVFVNDAVTSAVITELASFNVQVIALRCAGFNNVDLKAADAHGMKVVRVPAYSPYAVAEHTVGLMLSLNRKLHKAYHRIREGDFRLNGLLGFDMHGRTVGIVGTGKIGECVAKILSGFGCRLLGFDQQPNLACEQLGMEYVPLNQLLSNSDIVTFHCPLNPDTHHMVNETSIEQMKTGVMLINTSRGGLIDTAATIDGLKSGKIGWLGIDVYEEEADLFFEDFSDSVIRDDVFSRLGTFPNVMITGHQAFFTSDAMTQISQTTLQNLSDIEAGKDCFNSVK